MDRRLDARGVILGFHTYIDDGVTFRCDHVRPDTAVDDANVYRHSAIWIVKQEQFLDDMRELQNCAGSAGRIQAGVSGLALNLYGKASDTLTHSLNLSVNSE